jgi:hypothetical protein
LSNLRDVVPSFHRAENLTFYNLADVFIVHRPKSSCRTGTHEC